MDNEETAVSPLLAKLREEKAELTARITPTCRNCGSKHIVAWYLVDERQGLIIERAEDGSLEYDYDGDTSSGEPGADYEYRCRGCDTVARSLEYLVGDTDVDGEPEPAPWAVEFAGDLYGPLPDEEACYALAAKLSREPNDWTPRQLRRFEDETEAQS